MVDVGYCINGKHGVIRNVSLTVNPYSDHRVFTSADCKEQYCMKVDNIEYIIPSDIDNVGSLYTEEKMIELCQKVDPPMTFAEKFKEVFGYEVDRITVEDICSVVNCDNIDCDKCPYHDKYNWDEPYVKAEVKLDD